VEREDLKSSRSESLGISSHSPPKVGGGECFCPTEASALQAASLSAQALTQALLSLTLPAMGL
jgi:hypothetical protein